MLQDGWFINSAGELFAIINGSMYPMETPAGFPDLSPGYYDEDLNPVSSGDMSPHAMMDNVDDLVAEQESHGLPVPRIPD